MTEPQEPQEPTVTPGKRTVAEEIEVAGHQLVERVQQIIRQGNVRKIVVRSADDRVLLETSLTVSALAGGALALTGALVPVAVLGVIAAAVSKVKIEIVREVGEHDTVEMKKNKVDIQVEDENA